MPKIPRGSVRWFRKRKGCMPKLPKGSVRWFRHMKDCVPKQLVAQKGSLGTGKAVCLRNLEVQ